MLIGRAAPVARDQVWASWSADPMVLLAIAVVVAFHVAAWRAERTRPSASAALGRRTLAAGAAVAVLVIALVSPLDAGAEALFSLHMVQHLLLSAVAAPLLVLAAPGPTLQRLLPPPWRRAARLVARWTAAPGRRHPTAPVAAGTATLLSVLTVWHVPWLYDAALRNGTVHALEHATVLAAGVVYWSTVVRAVRRAQVLAGVAALAVASMHGAALGALLALAPQPWYEGHVAGAMAWRVDALADQQVAGALMWVPAGVVYLGSMVVVLHRALRDGPGNEPSGALAR